MQRRRELDQQASGQVDSQEGCAGRAAGGRGGGGRRENEGHIWASGRRTAGQLRAKTAGQADARVAGWLGGGRWVNNVSRWVDSS